MVEHLIAFYLNSHKSISRSLDPNSILRIIDFINSIPAGDNLFRIETVVSRLVIHYFQIFPTSQWDMQHAYFLSYHFYFWFLS